MEQKYEIILQCIYKDFIKIITLHEEHKEHNYIPECTVSTCISPCHNRHMDRFIVSPRLHAKPIPYNNKEHKKNVFVTKIC